MRVRDSGMPEEAYWETLFDPVQVVSGFPFIANSTAADRLLELGCGYGTFTVELAKRFRGRLDTFDIDPSMVRRTRERLSGAGLKNAFAYQGDFVGEDLPDDFRDYGIVILFHIMHLEDPEELLRRVLSRVRPGGSLAFLHWRPDRATPRGPDIEIRPTPSDYQKWSKQFCLTSPIEVRLLDCPHHFAVYCQTPEPT